MRACLFTAFLVALLACLAQAEDLELFQKERFEGGPWRIKADKLTYEAGKHTYIAEGRVEIREGDRRLSADYAEVNEITKIGDLPKKIAKVSGVKSAASQSDGAIEFAFNQGNDPRPQIAKLVINEGYDLLEMRPTGLSLEEIFLQLTKDAKSGKED